MGNNINLGVAKAIVSNIVTDEFMNESSIDKSKNSVTKLVETIKSSPVLMKEYVVISNIENKHINNDVLASKFIDKNIGVFSSFSKDEINEAHEALADFIEDSNIENISENKIKLYNSINVLITEGNDPEGDIIAVQDGYETILNHLKENVDIVEEEVEIKINENIDMDTVIEIAVGKFNERFSMLNEDAMSIVKSLVYGNLNDKKQIFESLKSENIEVLESSDTNGVEDKINEAIEKINNMTYSEDTVNESIFNLYNLKQSLI